MSEDTAPEDSTQIEGNVCQSCDGTGWDGDVCFFCIGTGWVA